MIQTIKLVCYRAICRKCPVESRTIQVGGKLATIQLPDVDNVGCWYGNKYLLDLSAAVAEADAHKTKTGHNCEIIIIEDAMRQ